jgi:hypothetical protein
MGDNKSYPLFSVIFEDGEKFVGGTSYFNTKWLEIPFKKIKRIFYKLPTNDYLCLVGDKYFHMIEATKDWMRISKEGIEKLNNKPKIEYAYIMVQKENKIISYRITLSIKKNERYRTGDITVREFDINDKFITGLNPDNWR